ncbi:hypothetical protein RAJCM14343_1728 [Rhodococcus aetherivorans]|uniref:Uncharacterized protein n=1 Tax=Rhodococcus aetherivorans TaxID=191292 RepID=A0ABQ0YIU3_9NOCA|nr:hypothetical protein RAJCM14343_1728 [Rhodococcus aetherivorans]
MDTHHVAATTNVSGQLVMAGSSHRRRLPEDPIVSVDSASSSPCRPSQPAGRVRRMSPCVGSTTDKSPLLLSPRNVGHWSIAGAAPPSATTYGHGVRSEPPRSEGRRRRSGGSCLSRLRSDDLTADEQSGLEQVLAGCRHLEVTVAQVTLPPRCFIDGRGESLGHVDGCGLQRMTCRSCTTWSVASKLITTGVAPGLGLVLQFRSGRRHPSTAYGDILRPRLTRCGHGGTCAGCAVGTGARE